MSKITDYSKHYPKRAFITGWVIDGWAIDGISVIHAQCFTCESDNSMPKKKEDKFWWVPAIRHSIPWSMIYPNELEAARAAYLKCGDEVEKAMKSLRTAQARLTPLLKAKAK